MAGDIIVTLKLLEKVPQIEKMIKREMAKKLTMALKRNLSKLKREINELRLIIHNMQQQQEQSNTTNSYQNR